MATSTLTPTPWMQFFDANGNPLVGGQLFTYASGTTSPQATYTDSTSATPNTNPVIMNSRGEAAVWLGTSAYSFTLKDALGNLIWTADDVNGIATAGALSTYIALLLASGGSTQIGFIQAGASAQATTAQTKLRERISIFDFLNATQIAAVKARSQTLTLSTEIAAALVAAAGKELYFPAGLYPVGTTLYVQTKTTLMGEGSNKSTLQLAAGTAAGTTLLQNYTTTGTINTYYDTDIELIGLTFDGASISTRTAELVAVNKVLNVLVDRCRFQNNTYIGLAIGANKNVKIINSTFTGLGRPIPSTVSSPAIWMDTSAHGTPYNVLIEGNHFYDNNWSAAYFMPVHGSFSNNICQNNGESTVFSNSNGAYLRYENNTITGTTVSHISGSGIEIGASYAVINGNTIDSCAMEGIVLTDTQNVLVCNNQIFNNGQDVATNPYGSGIGIISTTASPGQPDHIRICNNRIGDRQATKTQYAAILMAHYSPGVPVTNVAIHDNDFAEQKTDTIKYYTSGVFGTGSYLSNNYDKSGVLQPPFKYVTFNTSGTVGNQSVTGVGFRLRAIEIQAVLASTTQAFQSLGCNDGTSGSCTYSSVDGSGKRSGQTTGIIALIDGAGADVTRAEMVSADIDGFTIHMTTVAGVAVCIAKCFA